MNEIWKEIDWIPGFEGRYQVSNMGNVKGPSGEILTLHTGKDGYLLVTLHPHHRHSKDCQYKDKSISVHRLVAVAFLENPDNLPIINHKNEIKTDNRANNLEWCTARYNTCYGTAIERRALATRKKVIAYKLVKIKVGEYASVTEAAERLGISPGSISRSVKGSRNYVDTKGYLFRSVCEEFEYDVIETIKQGKPVPHER